MPVKDEKGAGLDKPDTKPDSTTTAPFVSFSTEDVDEEDPDDFPDYPTALLQELAENDEVKIRQKREDIRGRLATIYTVCTFLMFVLGFIVSIVDAAWRQVSIIDNLNTILPLISGLFLGSLGFVLGYYFRQIEDESRP